MKNKYLLFYLFVLLEILLSNCYAFTVDKIVVFGDSLSDNGNLFTLTSNAKKVIPDAPIIPKNPPYYDGRFSNGPVWVEILAQKLNVPLEDYAYGGAWAESIIDSKQLIPSGLGLQVVSYLVSALTDYHKENHLYIIWSGANDYMHGRYNGKGHPDIDYPTTNTVKIIQEQLNWLIYYGAKNILILNLPDLTNTPEVSLKGSEFALMVGDLIREHNKKLSHMIAEERIKHPNVLFVSIDVENDFNDIVTYPEKYNLKNVTDPCYDGSYSLSHHKISGEIEAAKKANIDIINNRFLELAYLNSLSANAGQKPCLNPDEYLFWDKVHPTRIIHQMISTLTYRKLLENGVTVLDNPKQV